MPTKKKVAGKSASDTGRTLANWRWQKGGKKQKSRGETLSYKRWRKGGFMVNKNRGIISDLRFRQWLRKQELKRSGARQRRLT